MSEVLQANIFFFITSIAVVVFTVFLCVLLYHVVKIVKSIRNIVSRIEEGSEVIAEDLSNVRKFFAENRFISSLVGMFIGKYTGNARQRSGRKRASRRSAGSSLSEE